MKGLIQDRFGRDTSHLRDSTGVKSPEFATECIAAAIDFRLSGDERIGWLLMNSLVWEKRS
ncbi:hypothetical protein [Pseudomonas sp. QTF5]|uniref:hypothetical protein n=1 Tax=Pseudomonas sp. QTF5 TaxID=1435425 RepID=UPI00117AE4AD|nr:hypothetical protein [Pseudomonas sp. QTF5]